jgi:hypothetical protein
MGHIGMGDALRRQAGKQAAHKDQRGGRGSIKSSSRAAAGPDGRWRSLREPASMLDLDGPLSGGQGRRHPCSCLLLAAVPPADQQPLKPSQPRTGGGVGPLSLFQISRGPGRPARGEGAPWTGRGCPTNGSTRHGCGRLADGQLGEVSLQVQASRCKCKSEE